MDKAFDIKDLEARLKAKGLPAIEGIAEIVAAEVFAWAEDSCLVHENALVKAIGVPALQIVKPLALSAIDKIDGEPG